MWPYLSNFSIRATASCNWMLSGFSLSATNLGGELLLVPVPSVPIKASRIWGCRLLAHLTKAWSKGFLARSVSRLFSLPDSAVKEDQCQSSHTEPLWCLPNLESIILSVLSTHNTSFKRSNSSLDRETLKSNWKVWESLLLEGLQLIACCFWKGRLGISSPLDASLLKARAQKYTSVFVTYVEIFSG